MKNYKFLVPVVLVVVFALSVYTLYDTKLNTLNQYNEYLDTARDYREQGILNDADEYYKKALGVQESIDLYLEIGEFYKECGNIEKTISWGTSILNVYPKEIKGYEFLMDIYAEKEDYIACFEMGDKLEKRNLSSDKIQKVLLSIEYEFFFNCEYSEVGIFSSGMCPVKVDDKWGYVDEAGNRVIGNQYLEVGAFSGKLAPVVDAEKKAYFIDTQGNKKHVVLDVDNVEKLGFIEEELFSLYNGKVWGFYNTDNKHVFGEYEDALSMGNGIAAVMNNDQWSLVSREGKDLTGTTYDGIASDEKLVAYRNERLFVYDDLCYHMIDSSGKVISDQKFEDVHIFNDTTYAAVKIDGKWGFIDNSGKMKIEPKYEDARSFANGFAAVKYAGKWGFINQEGKMVIEPEFDDSKDFNSSGCVFVKKEENWNLLKLYKYNH